MKIVITGGAGIIGSVLIAGLKERHDVVGLDLKSASHCYTLDLTGDAQEVREYLSGADAVIHLAWDIQEGGGSLSPILPENKFMGERILSLSQELGIPKVILASSVHASFGYLGTVHWQTEEGHSNLHKLRITSDHVPWPSGAYGASKVYLEMLGKAYADRGLEVIAVRFGNVTRDDTHGEYPFWLSHKDCCQFIEKCCTAAVTPAFSTLFAISNNACNPFDLSAARTIIGYEPEDNSACPFNIDERSNI